jgi:hypothetical protein
MTKKEKPRKKKRCNEKNNKTVNKYLLQRFSFSDRKTENNKYYERMATLEKEEGDTWESTSTEGWHRRHIFKGGL